MCDTAIRAKPGKYLSFLLDRESYGVEVLKIREIIRMQDITRVPQVPEYVQGVINLRGKIIPVIDLRLKFGLPQGQISERTCIVVVQVSLASRAALQIGLIVDAVEEVINVAAADLEATPDFGVKIDTDHIIGMAKVKGTVKTLLDIDRVIAPEAFQGLPQLG